MDLSKRCTARKEADGLFRPFAGCFSSFLGTPLPKKPGPKQELMKMDTRLSLFYGSLIFLLFLPLVGHLPITFFLTAAGGGAASPFFLPQDLGPSGKAKNLKEFFF